MHCDYIVVGQGLAGSLLSYHLIRKGKKVVVYDDADQPKASMAAAGIFNPFTGRKLVKTWMADELFTFLQDFYINLEADLNIKIMSKMPMYRPFLSVLEQNEWGGKYLDSGYRRYIDSIISPQDQLAEVVNPLGGMMLRQCGFVNIRELIKHIRSFLIEKDSLKRHRFSIQDLQLAKSNVIYDGIQASRIVFCEGPWLSRNHYFNWLPMRPVKGELIEIELQQSLDFIVNRGVFVLPVGGRTCKVGATFDNYNLDWSVTEEAKEKLLTRVKNLLKIPFKVTGQTAGIRPASEDRRPFIGIHPEFEPLAIFNGLGTKGVSLAPYLIHRFFEYLEKGEPLAPEVSISRYFSLYYSKN